MLSNESILHYIWKYKLFPLSDLTGTLGEEIQILHSGVSNVNSGPDFSDALLVISGTKWAGMVEIHIKSSDWVRHNHHLDKAYDNVILHVVWQHDAEITRTDGTLIPVLELKKFVDTGVLIKINQLKISNSWIPCEYDFAKIDNFFVKQWLDRVLIERLEYKSAAINEIFIKTKGSWEDTFYILLAKSFGFKINAEPFEILAKNLSQQILAKNKSNALQIESLVFGVAGFLDENFKDQYPLKLSDEYQFLKVKYNLESVEKHVWKFTKIRPDNFPTIRLAQFAALILNSNHLFSKVLEINDVKEYQNLFKNLKINSYWENHYLFDKEVSSKSTNLGDGSIDSLLINTIAPILFFYGQFMEIDTYKDKAFNLLETIKPENNSIIKGFENLGVKAINSFDTQSIIHLKNFYCNQKKCLNCGLGIKILKI